MLGWIRERNAKWILWGVLVILIVPFVFWGVQDYPTLTGANDVAIVDGHAIRPSALEHAFDVRYAQLSQELGPSFTPTPAELALLRREVLETLIERKLIEIATHRAGLVVPAASVAQAIRHVPAFREGGHFSLTAYRAVLAAHGISPASFEAAVRHGLRLRALRQGLEAGTVLAPSLVAWRYRRLHERRRFRYVLVPLDRELARVHPTAAAVQREYALHPAAYQAPERLTLAYVELRASALAARLHPTKKELLVLYAEHLKRFRTSPRWNLSEIVMRPHVDTTAAMKRARARLDALRQQILAGADFASLARRFSTDRATARHGGALGWVTPKELPAATVRALKGVPKGGLTPVLSTPFGWMLLRVNDLVPSRVKPFATVERELLVRYRRRAEIRLFHRLEAKMANMAFEHPHHLSPIAKNLGLSVQQVAGVTRTQGPGIARLADVRAAAFSVGVLDKRLNSSPIHVGRHAVVVLRVIRVIPRHELPLARVRARIVARLRRREAMKRVQVVANRLATLVRAGRRLPPAWPWKVTGFISEESPPTGVPLMLVRDAFHLPPTTAGKPSVQVVSLPGMGAAVLEVLGIKTPRFRSLPPARKKAYLALLLRQERSLELSLFVQELKHRAHVHINASLLRATGPGGSQ